MREQVLLGKGEHAAGAGGGVVKRTDDVFLVQDGVLLGEEKVDQQSDRVARRVVVTGGLVRGLVELADDVLERVPHVGVGHYIGVQVDGRERLHDLAQETSLLQRDDLLFEVEVLEHIDIGGEPVDVVDEIVFEPVRVLQKVGEAVLRGVIERPASLLLDLDPEPVRVLVCRSQVSDGLEVRLQDAVEAPKDRERENHVSVLVRAVGTPKLVGDRPDETTERTHKAPYGNRSTCIITLAHWGSRAHARQHTSADRAS